MKNKKLLFWLMAFLMLASWSTPALAADRPTTVIEVECSRLPEIRVIVPSSTEVLINPYKIPVSIQDELSGEQIVCAPVALKNESEVPLKVSVSMTASVWEDSDMRLISESTIGQELASKRAFIYLEIQNTSDPSQVSWDEKYDEEKHLLVRNGTRTRKDMVTLGADGQPLCYGAFRLTGDCVEFPRSSWTKADGIDVSIAFTFTATTKAP